MATKIAVILNGKPAELELTDAGIDALGTALAARRRGSASAGADKGEKVRCPFCRRRVRAVGDKPVLETHTDKVEGGKPCPGMSLGIDTPCDTCKVPLKSHVEGEKACKAFKVFATDAKPAAAKG